MATTTESTTFPQNIYETVKTAAETKVTKGNRSTDVLKTALIAINTNEQKTTLKNLSSYLLEKIKDHKERHKVADAIILSKSFNDLPASLRHSFLQSGSFKVVLFHLIFEPLLTVINRSKFGGSDSEKFQTTLFDTMTSPAIMELDKEGFRKKLNDQNIKENVLDNLFTCLVEFRKGLALHSVFTTPKTLDAPSSTTPSPVTKETLNRAALDIANEERQYASGIQKTLEELLKSKPNDPDITAIKKPFDEYIAYIDDKLKSKSLDIPEMYCKKPADDADAVLKKLSELKKKEKTQKKTGSEQTTSTSETPTVQSQDSQFLKDLRKQPLEEKDIEKFNSFSQAARNKNSSISWTQETNEFAASIRAFKQMLATSKDCDPQRKVGLANEFKENILEKLDEGQKKDAQEYLSTTKNLTNALRVALGLVTTKKSTKPKKK